MRTHGKDVSMHRLTEYSKKSRNLIPPEIKYADPPTKSKNELREIFTALHDALANWWRKKGVTINERTMWTKFFSEFDCRGAGRMTFTELVRSLRANVSGRPTQVR